MADHAGKPGGQAGWIGIGKAQKRKRAESKQKQAHPEPDAAAVQVNKGEGEEGRKDRPRGHSEVHEVAMESEEIRGGKVAGLRDSAKKDGSVENESKGGSECDERR
jgi:hypothetical protein